MDHFYNYGANGVFKMVMIEKFEGEEDPPAPAPAPETEEDKQNKRKIENIKGADELRKKFGRSYLGREAEDLADNLKEPIKKVKSKVEEGVKILNEVEDIKQRALKIAKDNKDELDRIKAAKEKAEREKRELEERVAKDKKDAQDRKDKLERDKQNGVERFWQPLISLSETQIEKFYGGAVGNGTVAVKLNAVDTTVKLYESAKEPLTKIDDIAKDIDLLMTDKLFARYMDALSDFNTFCEKAFNPPSISDDNIPGTVSQLKGTLDATMTFITDANYKYYYYNVYLVAKDVKYVKSNIEKIRNAKSSFDSQSGSDINTIRASFE
jgi:hypothetical protein